MPPKFDALRIMAAKKSAKKKPKQIPVPPASDWRTSDQDEIQRRVQRAIDEKHSIANLYPDHPVFSTVRHTFRHGDQLLRLRRRQEESNFANIIDHQSGEKKRQLSDRMITVHAGDLANGGEE